jgi:hypothetical protein
MEFLFDARWLAQTGTVVAGGVLGLMILAAVLMRPVPPGYLYWLGAGVCLLLGQAAGMVRLTYDLGASVVLANTFLVASMAFVACGMRWYAGVPLKLRYLAFCVLVMPAVSLGSLWLGWPETLRPVTFALLSVLLLGEAIVRGWRMAKRCQPAARVLACVLALFPLAFVSYAWGSLALASDPRQVLAARVITASFLLASIAPMLLVASMIWVNLRYRKGNATA